MSAPDDFCKVKRVGDRLKESFITMVIQKSKNNAFDVKMYFFSNVLDSPHREMINDGIMKLQTEGIIENIMEKWVRYSERNCEKERNPIFLHKIFK